MSTASASTSPPRWRALPMPSTPTRPSWRRCGKIPSCRASSSLPSPGMWARAAIRSVLSRRVGRNGMIASGTMFDAFGRAGSGSALWRLVCPEAATCTPLRAAELVRRSTSSPPMTVSRCMTSSATTRNTTNPITNGTATATTRTTVRTTAWRDPPATRPSGRSVNSKNETC